jgi:hypothetical protein
MSEHEEQSKRVRIYEESTITPVSSKRRVDLVSHKGRWHCVPKNGSRTSYCGFVCHGSEPFVCTPKYKKESGFGRSSSSIKYRCIGGMNDLVSFLPQIISRL